jgi:two-component system nitrogen regulation sensor histidine kinase NtrY
VTSLHRPNDATTVYDRSIRSRSATVLWLGAIVTPLIVSGAVLVFRGDLSMLIRGTVFGTGLSLSLAIGWIGGSRLVTTLGTIFDLLFALREGDYSIRGRVRPGRDLLQGVVAEVNLLTDDLRSGRRKRTETSRFLGKTLVALHSAVFVLDDKDCLTFINPAARRLIGAERAAVIGRDVNSLGLAGPLAAADGAILSYRFPSTSGRWAVRRAVWYSEGREHTMLMLHDLSAALSEEERRAWQRLIRVLSHELNNSLAPIGSLAGSLATLLNAGDRAAVDEELRLGLEVIGRRAHSLTRFLAGYGRLARLPPLQPRPFRLDAALRRFARLEQRKTVDVTGRAAVTIDGDEDQLGQAFINLMRNAVEATQDTGGGVRVDWRIEGEHVRVTIEDEGIGLPPSDGLFVPFFTTKPEGSGIGLTLTRLVIEAHAGTVELAARCDGQGVVATVRLPLRPGVDSTVRFRTGRVTDNGHAAEEPVRRARSSPLKAAGTLSEGTTAP